MRAGSGTWALAVIAAAAALGCGGGSGGGGGGGGAGTFTTSLPGSKPLSSLTDADKTQLCKDIQSYLSSPAVVSAECKLAGGLAASLTAALDDKATDAMLQTACAQAVTACTSGGADAGAAATGGQDPCAAATGSGATNCTATVSEYSACVSDLPKLFDVYPPCASITRASLNSDAGAGSVDPSSSSACAAVQAKCPDVKM